MNITDERLLEVLDTNGPRSPGKLVDSEYLHSSRSYLNKRLRILQKSGLVQMIGNGVYQITPKGIAYLAGEEDLRDVDKPE